MGIVLAKDGVVELHHLHTGNAQAATFKTGDNFADELTLDATRLQ